MPENDAIKRDIVVIGASAGGLEALKQLVARLPADLPASLFVVIHFPQFATSYLPAILNRNGAMRADHARDGEPIEPGCIYVAPIDNHLLIEDGVVRVWHGPKENHARPAIDPLFRSAASAYGERVVGVVLSGTLRDGTAGLIAIKHKGGLSVVQDPGDALFPGMPENAIKYDDVDYALPAAEIGPLLMRLAGRDDEALPVLAGRAAEPLAAPAGSAADLLAPAPALAVNGAWPPAAQRAGRLAGLGKIQPTLRAGDLDTVNTMALSDWDRAADKMVAEDREAQIRGERSGQPSIYTCPDCAGAMWQVDSGELTLFRCHVGHIFNPEDMLHVLSEAAESALWLAARMYADEAALGRQMAAKERVHRGTASAGRLERLAGIADRLSDSIRKIILSSATLSTEMAEAEKREAEHGRPQTDQA